MQKTKIFIAYAREDEAFLHRLREYLAPLERKQAIETWYDGKIAAGEQWDEKIKTHLHAADLILLLVSAKSLASNYFYDYSIKIRLFECHVEYQREALFLLCEYPRRF